MIYFNFKTDIMTSKKTFVNSLTIISVPHYLEVDDLSVELKQLFHEAM